MKRELDSIEPDISRASTLPGYAYTSPDIFEESREKIFAKSWQFICDTEQVKTPGEVYPFTLLEQYLDEPLLFSRDDNDKLHCLSNVCTHRGAILVEHPCHLSSMRCRYHGRKFDLDGKFRSMPEFEEAKDFPCEKDNLTQVPHGQFGEFLFASLDPAASFAEVFQPIIDRVGWMPFKTARFDSNLSRDYLVQANWMAYCDNYLEGFHIPYVHPSLSAVLDYSNYSTEVHDFCNLQLAVGKGSDFTFKLPESSPDFGQDIAAYYYWVFPNLMLNFYPWGISVNVVKPVRPDLTKVSFLPYVWDRDKLSSGAGSELDVVEREDEVVVESVQRGVKSRFYDRGRFSPAREQNVHHFHGLVTNALS